MGLCPSVSRRSAPPSPSHHFLLSSRAGSDVTPPPRESPAHRHPHSWLEMSPAAHPNEPKAIPNSIEQNAQKTSIPQRRQAQAWGRARSRLTRTNQRWAHNCQTGMPPSLLYTITLRTY